MQVQILLSDSKHRQHQRASTVSMRIAKRANIDIVEHVDLEDRQRSSIIKVPIPCRRISIFVSSIMICTS
ncbi:hypothetical protein BDZ45DRAFT_171220 [Acephala macrosclerotiorum]|nr:hypothetical protein BDZ45DRAFT_171220 [Acephala macrosclerotiorum]